MKKFSKDYSLKDHYKFDCVVCGHNQSLTPSIMMEMGLNTGSGGCLKCKEFLHLEIDEKKGVVISQRYERSVKCLTQK